MKNLKLLVSSFILKKVKSLLYRNSNFSWALAKFFEKISNGKFKILKIEPFEKLSSRETTTKSKEITLHYPISQDERLPIKAFQKSIGYTKLNSALLSPGTSSVILNETIYIQKYSTSLNNDKLDHVSGLLVANSNTHALINIPYDIIILEKGINFCGNWYKNWYHWTIEILSKYVIYKELGSEFISYPLLMPKYIESSRNHKAIVKELFDLNQVQFIDDNTWYNVKSLIQIETPALDTPNLKFNKKAKIFNADFYFSQLKSYREILISKIKKNEELPKKIFLSRTQKSRKYNQKEVFKMFSKYGFESVYCEKLNFKEQQELFFNADIIVGPTGAAWTNIIFGKENSNGIIWMPDAVDELVTFSNLARLSNINLVHHYYKTATNNWSEYNNSDHTEKLSINALENIIQKMIL